MGNLAVASAPPPAEREKTVPITIRWPEALYERLLAAAFKQRRTINSQVVFMIEQVLDMEMATASPAVAITDGPSRHEEPRVPRQ